MTSPPANRNTPLGLPANSGPRTWVQTERAAHEAWARLAISSPRAAALLHTLVARMGRQNAVVVSQKTLAKLMGCSERTVRYAVDDLRTGRWIEVVQLGSTGSMNAYVVNDRVAWGERRSEIGRLSVFSANVVADADDQKPETLTPGQPLRRLPMLYPGEQASPAGPGEPPPAQPLLEGIEPPSLGIREQEYEHVRMIDPGEPVWPDED